MNLIVEYIKKEYSVKDYKFKWKREKVTTGRWSSFDNNDLRGYILSINNPQFCQGDVAFISNVSKSNNSSDLSKQWSIWFITKGTNTRFKKRFELNDIENAKKFTENLFVTIMNDEHTETKDKILALGRINKEMY